MRAGQLQQFASPTELYDWPANVFVTSFIGSPAMNRFDATAERGGIRVGSTLLQPPTPSSTRPRGTAS
jgi:multiple sugar transport system ATP-binding protein